MYIVYIELFNYPCRVTQRDRQSFAIRVSYKICFKYLQHIFSLKFSKASPEKREKKNAWKAQSESSFNIASTKNSHQRVY